MADDVAEDSNIFPRGEEEGQDLLRHTDTGGIIIILMINFEL